jgi:NAD(P)-dependent dehydrogenase (short-subunit alcohol dehydrogenase family)
MEDPMAQKVRDIELESGLRNKRVVILGGSSGIGLAVAQQVVEHGAELVVASSNTQRVQQAITSLGGKAEGHTLDLTDERAIQTFFEKLGSFDHLVFTPVALSSCVIGQHSRPLSMEAPTFGQAARSY